MASITLQNIVKEYGTGAKTVPVIHNLNAQINDGEFVVIVGPSGCGKSTLLRMVAGLEEITGGHISIPSRKQCIYELSLTIYWQNCKLPSKIWQGGAHAILAFISKSVNAFAITRGFFILIRFSIQFFLLGSVCICICFIHVSKTKGPTDIGLLNVYLCLSQNSLWFAPY